MSVTVCLFHRNLVFAGEAWANQSVSMNIKQRKELWKRDLGNLLSFLSFNSTFVLNAQYLKNDLFENFDFSWHLLLLVNHVCAYISCMGFEKLVLFLYNWFFQWSWHIWVLFNTDLFTVTDGFIYTMLSAGCRVNQMVIKKRQLIVSGREC